MIILIITYVDVFNILLLVFQKKERERKETNMSRFKVDQLRQYFSSL